jgi:hypothetical protein
VVVEADLVLALSSEAVVLVDGVADRLEALGEFEG